MVLLTFISRILVTITIHSIHEMTCIAKVIADACRFLSAVWPPNSAVWPQRKLSNEIFVNYRYQ